MTGFISAVGISIVLGQLDNFTGYDSQGGNRVAAALDLVLHLGGVDPASLVVGLTTVAGILVLQRTRLGRLGGPQHPGLRQAAERP
ncbi:SulP family inorganic anion transporter [Nocardioides sp. NPDC057767]|uniref:SulP family inorganic anion transporter n=1 Tax=unclassified Nocardioides TaxID=2615069 RepID=UPI00366D1CA3